MLAITEYYQVYIWPWVYKTFSFSSEHENANNLTFTSMVNAAFESLKAWKVFIYYSILEPDFICLFGLRFYIPVNSYGHVETPNHTFFLGMLN